MAGILETLVEWLVSVSQWFNGWDITLLVPALWIGYNVLDSPMRDE